MFDVKEWLAILAMVGISSFGFGIGFVGFLIVMIGTVAILSFKL